MATTTTADALQKLLDERAAFWENTGKPLADIAAERDFTADEQKAWDEADADMRRYGTRIDTVKRDIEQEESVRRFSAAPVTDLAWRNLDTGERAAVEKGQSVRSHPVFERTAHATARNGAAESNYGSLGAMVRAVAIGGGGAAVVPTQWSGDLIDLARSASVMGQAGATVVPMEAGTVKIGRQTGDPTAAFRAENGTTTPSDPTFDSVTLTARTLTALVTASIEWWQDAAPSADQIVGNALAEAIAAQIDLTSLYGGITTGAGSINLPTDPNPRGILATLNAQKPANVLGGSATNGTTPAGWGEAIDLAFTVRDGNEEPTGLVWSSKLARQYAKLTATDGQPLNVPPTLADVPRYTVNRIPSYTKGTLTTASDLFAGDFRQLIIGQRLAFTLQPLGELYAAEGKFGVLATWRGDIALARNSAFSVYRSLAGAA